MAKFATILIFVSFAFELSFANGSVSDETIDRFNLFARADNGTSEHFLTFANLIEKLQIKKTQYKSESRFLEYMFYHVHRKMLGEYEQYVPFEEIFSKEQKYDCVTGTILYSLILDELDIRYEIRESDFHVYMLAFVDGEEYLFESTDPLNGFVKNKEEISFRKNEIMKDARKFNARIVMDGVGSKEVDLQKVEIIDNNVNLIELSGLHYYNQALYQFNHRQFKESFELIEKAAKRYPSDRIMNAGSYIYSVTFED